MLRADAFLSILLSNGEALLLEIKKLSLVFPHKGKNKGKRSFLWQQASGKCRENQWVSEIRIDKPEFVASFILLFKIANYSID